MKILWAALFGMTALSATAWSFEGDWSTWDKPQGTEASRSDDLSYSTPGTGTGELTVYQLRALGRSESRWMGSLEGRSLSIDRDGKSHFDWTRRLGRAEAYHIDGSIRTAAVQASLRAPGEALTGGEFRCNLIEANRTKGRDEARTIKIRPDRGGKPPTTWEMDEESERKAAAQAAGGLDC